MKMNSNLLRTPVIIFLIILSVSIVKGQNFKTVTPEIQDAFYELPANQDQLQGYLGHKIDLCINNRIKAEDGLYLVEPFKHRNETHFWQTEFWGKWITSAIRAYEYNHDPDLLKNIQQAVSGLLATQTPDGYIGNYADNAHLKEWDIWGRKYTLLGLIAYYDLTKDKKTLLAAIHLADHLLSEVGPGKADIVKTGNYRGMPSSSVLEPIMLLYNRTGEQRYLEFAKYIVAQWETPDGPQLISKALAGVDVADRFPKPAVWWGWENGQKAYEMMSCYEGLLELYRVTGEARYLEAVEKTVKNIIDTEINIAGSGSAFECWYHGKENQVYPSYHTMETCVTMTWMKLCDNLLRLTGKSLYGDQIEKSAYNALLASMMPDGSTFAKYSPLEGERGLGEDQCGMHINCCIANGPRAFVMLPSFATMRSGDGIVINLYCQSETEINLPGKNVLHIQQITDYPVSGNVIIKIDPEKEASFTIGLRIPAWSSATSLKVNGNPVSGIETGTYRSVDRVWKKGDQIELTLDMRGRLEKTSHQFALVRGPIVLARDSRFNDGDVDRTGVVAIEQDGYIKLTANPDKPENIWMSFTAPLILGTNLEMNSGAKSIKFCDYSSAGNVWNDKDRYRVWLNRTLDVKE